MMKIATLLLLFCNGAAANRTPTTRSTFLREASMGITASLLSVTTNPPVASAALESSSQSATQWPLGKVAFSLLPLYGTSTSRPTIETTVVPNKIYTHDQLQGIVNVDVPVRQTVIVLSQEAGGGLLIVNPLAPTPECLKFVKTLENKFGPVRHLLLATSALEHKATFGPFAQNYRDATCWVNPGQWSFPIQVPIEWSGVLQRGSRLRELNNGGSSVGRLGKRFNEPPEWITDVEFETLGPLVFKSVGTFSETALFHKSTRSLILTDTVIRVSDEPPPIIATAGKDALLYHSRNSVSDLIVDDEATRRRGWRRMVQFGLTFFPSRITVSDFGEATKEASKLSRDVKKLSAGNVPGGLYPWSWAGDEDQKSFDAYKDRLFCPPILTKLILDREPERVTEWVKRIVGRFDFVRIIPGHLDNDIKANGKDFERAFTFLDNNNDSSGGRKNRKRVRGAAQPLKEDLQLLQSASDLLTDLGVVEPSRVR